MLKDMKLTHGIGVRIAHSTPRLFPKDVLIDQVLTFVTNVKQKKPTKRVPHKPKIPFFHNRDMLSPVFKDTWSIPVSLTICSLVL
jgi:hypothetical protein